MNSDNYNYESPITRIQSTLIEEMVKKEEDHLMCEVRQTIGYQIDKAELIKALNYDRDQYERGYQDGRSAGYRQAESEKRKGRWLINSDGYYPYCSACLSEPENRKMTDYCPKCGAYMKAEAEDDGE